MFSRRYSRHEEALSFFVPSFNSNMYSEIWRYFHFEYQMSTRNTEKIFLHTHNRNQTRVSPKKFNKFNNWIKFIGGCSCETPRFKKITKRKREREKKRKIIFIYKKLMKFEYNNLVALFKRIIINFYILIPKIQRHCLIEFWRSTYASIFQSARDAIRWQQHEWNRTVFAPGQLSRTIAAWKCICIKCKVQTDCLSPKWPPAISTNDRYLHH